ncbi:MAG: midcut-by-XrtH protein [Halioglobus sp.]|nr:midcut-by-XrtH protein [Halioglobus sp.]
MQLPERYVLLRSLTAVFALGAMLPLAAQAGIPGGSITFTPAAGATATPVPTLGGVMLLLLALLLAFVAFTHLRRQRAKAMLVLCLAGGSLLSAAGGVTLIERASAGGDGIFFISNSQGETLPIFPNTFNEYTNNTSVPMGVQSVELPSSNCPNGPVPACTGGLELTPGEQCQIDCVAFQDSDRRLKTDIVAVGQTASGLPLYQFRYRGDDAVYLGVMAQDVLSYMPAAVALMPNGYMGVNYQMLGLQMTRIH